MILQALHDLYPRLSNDPAYEIAPPGFSPQKISFKIVLDDDGSLHAIEDARQPDKKGKLQNVIMQVCGGAKPPGAGINPCFLWDNQTYLLGRQPADKKPGFGQDRFEAFRNLHLAAEKSIDLPTFSIICRFLEKWNPADLEQHPILSEVGTGFGVFELRSRKTPIHDDSKIKEWWLKTQSHSAEVGVEGVCLISGETTSIARLHPKIKSVTGAQSAGASLVSFNDAAYESYGKDQGANAPVGEDAAFRYGSVLNSLLTGPQSSKHRLRIGDTTTVFWTEKPTIIEDLFTDLLSTGSRALDDDNFDPERIDQLKRLLKAIRSGGRYTDLGEDSKTPFYLLGLAPNAARLSVRFFLRSTTEELLAKLHLHHEHLSMQREFTEKKGNRFPDPEFPAIKQLLGATVRVSGGKPAYDEISPLVAGALTRSITEGTNYPESLLTAIIRRIHADREINYLRAATIKAVLTRNHHQTIPTMLDTESPHQSYHLGRLFAALEKIQEEGHEQQTKSKLKNTIRDKFFSSASATPVAVFPRLEQLSTHHRRHLEYGRKVFFDQLVGEIKSHQSAISATRKIHNLEEQSFFTIGYYHQRRHFFTKKEQPASETT
jgi:CRISPR-associated protein Csd1